MKHKTTLAISVLLLQAHLSVCAQNAYAPLLEDGKEWIYRSHNFMSQTPDSYYRLWVAGDTLVDGRQCKKIMHEDESGASLFCILREEGRKVYKQEEEAWSLVYDYGLGVGETIQSAWDENLCLVERDTLRSSGKAYARMHFSVEGVTYHKGDIVWIEGIGSADGLLYQPAYAPFAQEQTKFLSCCKGQAKIFGDDSMRYDMWNYVEVSNWRQEGNDVFGETENINLYCDKTAKEQSDFYTLKPYKATKGYPINVREAGGRVFANLAEYKQHLAAMGGDAENIPYETTPDGEVVLYDFNMEVGDAFPCGIKVQEKEVIRLEDMEPRRMLKLNNGLVLIEGIGCTNSPGTYAYYLNPPSSDADKFASLTYFSQLYGANESIYSAPWRFNPASIQQAHSDQPGKALYDLQGRRLAKQPQQGMYIKDGRVRVK